VLRGWGSAADNPKARYGRGPRKRFADTPREARFRFVANVLAGGRRPALRPDVLSTSPRSPSVEAEIRVSVIPATPGTLRRVGGGRRLAAPCTSPSAPSWAARTGGSGRRDPCRGYGRRARCDAGVVAMRLGPSWTCREDRHAGAATAPTGRRTGTLSGAHRRGRLPPQRHRRPRVCVAPFVLPGGRPGRPRGDVRQESGQAEIWAASEVVDTITRGSGDGAPPDPRGPSSKCDARSVRASPDNRYRADHV
jgi:hypothetical protein